jgi:hypothetical protein
MMHLHKMERGRAFIIALYPGGHNQAWNKARKPVRM